MESIRQLFKIGRGPSSSHTMGPENACKYILSHYKNISRVSITLYGSLAFTGKGHLTDKVLMDCLKDYQTEISFDYKTTHKHPNTLKFELYDKANNKIDEVLIYSIGGGSIEVEGQEKEQSINIYPCHTFEEIKQYCLDNNISLAQYVYKFEDKDIKKYLNEENQEEVANIRRNVGYFIAYENLFS